jgi:hypothetical protein
MIRNLKALGLALGAVFAFGAMAASSASAVDTITGPAGGFPITATNLDNGVHNIHRFEITSSGTSVECTTAHFQTAANVANGASTITVTPTYKGTLGVTPTTTHCEGEGVGTVDVNMHGCTYTLEGNTVSSDGTRGPVWINCTAGNEISVAVTELGVTLHIHAQTPTTGGVTYTNVAGTPTKVTVNAQVTGITYSCEPAFVCFLGGIPSEGNDADYTGSVVASSGTNNISSSTS